MQLSQLGTPAMAKFLRIFMAVQIASIMLAIGYSLARGQWINLIFMVILVPAVKAYNHLTTWLSNQN